MLKVFKWGHRNRRLIQLVMHTCYASICIIHTYCKIISAAWEQFFPLSSGQRHIGTDIVQHRHHKKGFYRLFLVLSGAKVPLRWLCVLKATFPAELIGVFVGPQLGARGWSGSWVLPLGGFWETSSSTCFLRPGPTPADRVCAHPFLLTSVYPSISVTIFCFCAVP